ncbi:hypothetical protein NDU88_007997 [Pleurodeles waltl]|uniref:Uncharacterized protein n=1 Tax=Pleurodeles waltl TaxID=8319 RepID=A0AAV7SU10_PLEWA|nr:hypothetical protein NDU88_007997 [Pleurodeles waltl]
MRQKAGENTQSKQVEKERERSENKAESRRKHKEKTVGEEEKAVRTRQQTGGSSAAAGQSWPRNCSFSTNNCDISAVTQPQYPSYRKRNVHTLMKSVMEQNRHLALGRMEKQLAVRKHQSFWCGHILTLVINSSSIVSTASKKINQLASGSQGKGVLHATTLKVKESKRTLR